MQTVAGQKPLDLLYRTIKQHNCCPVWVSIDRIDIAFHMPIERCFVLFLIGHGR